MPVGDKFLSVVEVAKQLGLCVDTVRARIASGDLIAVNIGAAGRPTWKVKQSSVDAFVAARSNTQRGLQTA